MVPSDTTPSASQQTTAPALLTGSPNAPHMSQQIIATLPAIWNTAALQLVPMPPVLHCTTTLPEWVSCPPVAPARHDLFWGLGLRPGRDPALSLGPGPLDPIGSTQAVGLGPE